MPPNTSQTVDWDPNQHQFENERRKRLREEDATISPHPFTGNPPHAARPQKKRVKEDDTQGHASVGTTIGVHYHVPSNPGTVLASHDRGFIDQYHATYDTSTPGAAQNLASTLQGAHNFTVRDHASIMNIGTHSVSNVNHYCQISVLDIMEKFMEKYVSHSATHDSPVQDPDRKCHPETRLTVLKQIHDWADNPDGRESIFWLHGPAGVGKSAIAQTIAHSYSRQKVAATFFFYRSDPNRNDGNRLFTTLAWQLALSIPAVKTHIVNALGERPDLPKKDVETQFQELIVKPLQALTEASSQTQLSSLVMIIDGVDECIDEKLQRRILTVIGNAVNNRDFPLRFLICSRPEAHIEEAIDSFQCPALRLDLAKLDDGYRDIEIYLGAEFSRIASEQDLDPTWPGDEKFQTCVYKSSGNFVYASTLIKIIDDEDSSAPTQLDIVLGLKPHGGMSLFAELDGLYMEILKRQRDWTFLHTILSILTVACISSIKIFPPIEIYKTIMNISEMELRRKLRGMRSLLTLDPHINFHHRSFLDFLQDSSRSGQYYISQRAGERRYLDLITASIVQHVPMVFEQPDCHQKHFSLRINIRIEMLSVEELQQALQPLVHIQEKLISIESASWQQVLRCKQCNILSMMWQLVLYLTCLKETSTHKAAYPHQEVIAVEQGLTEHPGPPTPSVATEVEQVVLEKSDLDICLSSVLVHLREMKFPPSAMTIDLMRSLLTFDYVETAMRVPSIPDGQLLVDFIDYLINDKEPINQHRISIARSAALFALQVHGRLPVLPRSLFCPGDLSQRPFFNAVPFDLFFTPMFLSRILDRNYVLRVSCIFNEGGLEVIHDDMNTYTLIKEWRRSSPSSVMMLRVMLGLAKAIQYFDSMDLLLGNITFTLDTAFLDSECHVKIFPHDLFRLTSEEERHWNVSKLGGIFYDLCFDVEFPYHDKDAILLDPERPSEPEISDELWWVIQWCCARDGPTIGEVVQEMESWIENMQTFLS